MADFYAPIVDLTVRSAAWQRPFLQPHRQAIRRFFLTATNSVSCARLSPKSRLYVDNVQFALALRRIVETLFEHWNGPGAMSQRVLNRLTLPYLVSATIGFDNVFYIDFADVDLVGMVPFTETTEPCFAAEFLKFVVNWGNFVIAGENQNRLMEVMQLLEEGVIC
jgi:hypothetical protein